jgi:TonB family protein
MSPNFDPERQRPGDLVPFLVLSLLTHAALLFWMSFEPLSLGGDSEPAPIVVQLQPEALPLEEPSAVVPPPVEPAESLAPSQPPPTRAEAPPTRDQIVTPSDRENDIAPEGPAFLSDRNNTVEQETIRRGNPEAGTPGVEAEVAPSELPDVDSQTAPEQAAVAEAPEPTEETEAAPPEAAPAEEAAPPETESLAASQSTGDALLPEPARPLPGLDRLFAPPAEVLARARSNTPATPPSQEAAPRENPRRDLLAAPPPVPGVFAGLRGNFDHLPDVAAGQLTMLNTKADRFAPFVRRVGTRVFQNLLIYQRRDLKAPDILAATEIVAVRAILDESGRLTSLEIMERSGSPALDRTLLEALRAAAFDPNPPPEAANTDGKFEFIFQAQIVASVQPSIREPRIRAVESRLRIGLM